MRTRAAHLRLSIQQRREDLGRDVDGLRRQDEAGFTLIELVVVVAIMPIVVGGLITALLAIISISPSVSNRINDSGNAQIASTYYEKDVQTAQYVTTNPSSTNPSPCGSGTQLLGLQTGTGTQVSYSLIPEGTGAGAYNGIERNVCQNGTQTDSSVVADHVANPATGTGNPVATVTCTSPSNPTCSGTPAAYQNAWESTDGVLNISFPIDELGSRYTVGLVATPSAGINAATNNGTSAPAYNCGFAQQGTGTYASTLCFLDFTGYNTGTACAGGGNEVVEGITNTPFTMSMCVKVTGTSVAPAAIPTYTNPPTSEAFLGNEGFYTGIPGNPALYQTGGGGTTISITNIQVLGTGGIPATNWQLVTGDAESTDQGEEITWTGNWSTGTTVPTASQVWSLVPNSPTSAMGNACANPTPGSGTSYGNGFTGIGSPVVECAASVSSDKTGTPMIAAPEPSSLTAYMYGTGLEAIFVGLLLPS